MVHDNFPAGVIITNGLGGPGCGSFILAHFDLFLGVGGSPLVPVVEVRVIGHGGSFRPEYYPRPRDEEDELVWEPREDEEFEVVIKANLTGRTIERHYFVRKRTQVVVAQVLHFLNTTKSRINVGVGKITKTARDAAVRIRNIGKKS